MPLDFTGNVTLALSVTSLFLLILGLPLVAGISNKKNLTRHGYLTIIALTLQTILVFVIMVPSLIVNMSHILDLSMLSALNTWIHIGLGVFALGSGFAYVILWLWFSRSKMRCFTVKKYMLPTFIIWIIAIVTGALIHILQFF
jgi:hypothetical protein